MFERIIADHARSRRAGPAYADIVSTFTYGQMADDIARCTAWLKTRSIMPGARVALHVPSAYRHWVLFFALEACSAVSVAASTLKPLTSSHLSFLKADFYIAEQPPAAGLGIPGEVLDRGWLTRVRKFRHLPPRPLRRSDDDPVCIVLSSGTTGTPKKVLLTRGMIDARVIHGRSAELITATSRVLMALPNDSIGGLMTMLSAWAVGGTVCIHLSEVPAERALQTLRPTMVAGAPSHFAKLLAALPDDFSSDRPIDAATGGGALPAPIAATIRRKLGGRIKLSYASTEMGFVARSDLAVAQEHEGAVGFVLPGVEVSIRDDEGSPLPHGEVGEVWVRSSHVVRGYIEDPDQTALSFRDGWFHPGDLGTVRADGLLALYGRTDDLMNYRGRKMLPSRIESAVLDLGVVDDVAVFMACASGFIEPQLWVVCVAALPFEPSVLASAIPENVPHAIARIDVIPRNVMGKIERGSLRAQVEAGTLQSAPAQS